MKERKILTGIYRGRGYMLPFGRITSEHYQLAKARGYLIWNHRASLIDMCENVRWRIL